MFRPALWKILYRIALIFSLPGLAVAASIYLCEFTQIEYFFPSADKYMHLITGIAVSFSFIVLIKNLQYDGFIPEASNWFTILLLFTIQCCFCVLWEFGEFSLDWFFGTANQGDNFDTMTDMLLGAGGGVIPLIFFRYITVRVPLGS